MPRVSEEYRVARREQIVLAAIRCVAAEGFHKTTMNDVIRESGLSAGAVYGYFRSKEELILAIADRALGLMSGRLGEMSAADPVPGPVEVVGALAEAVESLAREAQVDITRVAVAAWAEAVRNPQLHDRFAEKMRMMRDAMTQLIRAQQAAGSVDPASDPAQVAQAFVGLFPGYILQRLILGDVTPQTYAAGVAGLLYQSPGTASPTTAPSPGS
jgi:AcrR family transcriptional regulator